MAASPLLRAILLAGMLVSCTAAPQDSSAGAAGSSPDTPVTSSPEPQDTSGSGGASPSPVGAALPSDCKAPKAEPFVGRRADASVRTDRTNAVAPITAIRWVGPGDATTEDYGPQRLNVMLDVGGVIRSVHCG